MGGSQFLEVEKKKKRERCLASFKEEDAVEEQEDPVTGEEEEHEEEVGGEMMAEGEEEEGEAGVPGLINKVDVAQEGTSTTRDEEAPAMKGWVVVGEESLGLARGEAVAVAVAGDEVSIFHFSTSHLSPLTLFAAHRKSING